MTNAELNRIKSKVFSTDRLNQIKDIFLFSCYTGLAYIDIKNLKSSDIQIGKDGEQWIISTRKKTGAHTHIPLLQVALNIMGKYNQKRAISGYVLPVPSNQKVNAYLNEIVDLCEFGRNLTFHLARYSFATTITLGNGVPIDTVKQMLGHASVIETERYAQTLDTKISADMKALRIRLNNFFE
jgi:integrase